MPVNIKVKVIGIGPDSDQFTGQGYTAVTLAIESPIPKPPPQAANMHPPIPRPIIHKHILHIFLPNTQWRGQYSMWQDYNLTIEDTGEMRLTLSQEGV